MTTVMIASQDPEALEFEVHKLSTITVVHKTRSIDSLMAGRSNVVGAMQYDES